VGVCLAPGCLRLFQEGGTGGQAGVRPSDRPAREEARAPLPVPTRPDYHLRPPPLPPDEPPAFPGGPERSEPPEPPPAPHEVKSADGKGASAVVRATRNLPPREAEPEPVVAALRHLLADEPEKARQVLHEGQCPDPELLLALLSLAGPLSREREGEGRWTPEDAAALLSRLDGLEEVLSGRAPLVVEKARFCRHISTFGVYDPLPPAPRFQGGVNGRPGERVQVYVQVRNFLSRKKGEHYETTLASTLELLDPSREVVARMDFPACIDRSRSRRRDYFINFRFHIPPRLPSGSYTLRIQVRDAASPAGGPPRTSRCSLDFSIR
jgi:hypothetical protein